MIKKNHDVIRNRQVKVKKNGKTVNMSTQRMHHTLHVELGICKLSISWVSRALNMNRNSQCPATILGY